MYSVITIGISNYIDPSITSITCANSDAKMVYSTFKHILGNEFSDFSSISLNNIREIEFFNILAGVSKALSNDDTIILYFSCHASIDNYDNFMINFSDMDGKGSGQISSNHLKEKLSKCKNNFILIFDCCHSEVALRLADTNNISSTSNIAVIASTEYYATAKFNSDGSIFTKNFCKAMMKIYESGSDVTINSIALKTRDLGSSCFVNLGQDNIDIVIKKALLKESDYIDFSDVFLSKLSNSNRYVREMMWYSLSDIPSKISLKIIEKFIRDSACTSEADWLVRRAIGSFISTMKGNEDEISVIISNMLCSSNWMLQTIGLIACRNNIDKNIADKMVEIILSDSNISLVWLADLYFSDSNYGDLFVSLRSNLAKTGWGLIQIWDRYLKKQAPQDLFDEISKSNIRKDALSQLKTEIFLRDVYDLSFDIKELDENILELANSKLISILYGGKARGRTIDGKKKWLLSIMYGNWRGRISVNLDEYFNNNDDSTIIRDLELVKSIPSPEKRAALFSYLQCSPEILFKYKEYILWGVTDAHPWVRKEAVLSLKDDYNIIKKAFNDIIDRQLFIGMFDLVISSSNYIDKPFLKKYVNNYELTECEKKSLLMSIINE